MPSGKFSIRVIRAEAPAIRATLASVTSFRQTLRLADGRTVRIRPISADDAGPIAAGFALLTDEEIRSRFLHQIKSLGPEQLQQLTHPDRRNEFVLVAAEALPPGQALVMAVARLSRDSADKSRAEFGILVSHFVSGQGLGRRLLQLLLDWGARHGLREIYGDVMAENAPMLRVAAALGFERERVPGDAGLLRVRKRIA